MEENKCNHLKPENIALLNEDDSFRIMYEMQSDLQERLGRLAVARKANMQQKCKMVMEEIFCMNTEFAEMLDRLPFKHWKNYEEKKIVDWVDDEQRNEVLFEYIDVFHFMLNVALIMGFSPEEIFRYYVNKNKENHRRQDEGYGKK